MDFLASAPSVDDIDITDQVAINHEECSICFEPLCIKQVGYFCDNRNKRICRHYLHFECISTIINNKACPICRRAYHHVKEVSDPRVNAKKFFNDIDLDGNGKLSFEEITDGLKATLPLDFRNIDDDIASQIRLTLDNVWFIFDLDGSGHIEMSEFVRPDGLADTIIATIESL